MKNRPPLVNISVVGQGEWGKRVSNIASLISRFNVVGAIEKDTPQQEKDRILLESDLIYIATQPEDQKPYVDFGLANDKDIICESPFLVSKNQRDEVYQKVLYKPSDSGLLYVNYPYVMDALLQKCSRPAMTRPFTSMFVKCMGPQFHDNEMRAKKLYSAQAINIILQIMGTRTHRFDKIIMHDNNSGEFNFLEQSCIFSWGYAMEPSIEMSVKGKDFSFETAFSYDEYDQVIPLLTLYLSTARALADFPTAPKALSIQSLNNTISAEHFSDLFVAMFGARKELAYEDLVFAGGFKQRG